LVGFALTGERHTHDLASDLPGLLTSLHTSGWSPERIRAHAHQRWSHDLPWPYPVDPHDLKDVGPAQWYATLGAVRISLGLDGERQHPSRRTSLTPEEQRLTDDVPPHHGPTG